MLRSIIVGIPFVALAACMPRFAVVDTGKPLTDKDLALSFSKGKNADADEFSEQLVIRAQMDADVSVYAKLTVTNLASADGRADLTVNVTLADGRKLRFKERRDRDEWTFGRDKFFAEVGNGSVEVGFGRTHVVAKNDEFEIDFEVTTELPPLRPKGGLFDRGGRFYTTTIPIPRGVARAHIKVLTAPEPADEVPPDEAPAEPPVADPPVDPSVDPSVDPAIDGEGPTTPLDLLAAPVVPVVARSPGSAILAEAAVSPSAAVADAGGQSLPEEIELEGVGYAEHRAGNVAPYDLARRWYSILSIGDDETVMLSVFEQAQPEGTARDPQAKPGPVQGFFFAANDDAMALYEPEVTLQVRGWYLDDKTRYPLPEIVFVHDLAHTSFEGVIVANALSDRKDDLEGLSRIERIVVRKFMKPWTFRFDRARFLFRKQNVGEAMRELRGEERLQVQQLN